MSKKIIDTLHKKSNHLNSFLKEVKKVNDIVPIVKQAKEDTDWAISVFEDIPVEASEKIDETKLEEVFQQDMITPQQADGVSEHF